MFRLPDRSSAVRLALAALVALTAFAALRVAEVDARPDPAPKQDLRSPDARDAGEGRGTYTAPNVMIVKVREPVPERGIDWADAGIGAAGLLGVMLLGFGGALAVVHRRHGHSMPRTR